MHNNIKKKLFFVAPSLPSFIKKDIEILSLDFEIILNTYNWRKKILTPFYMIHQTIILLFQLNKISTIYICFGGYWAMMPSILGKLFRKKVFIVLNGTDCASIPKLNYGSLRKTTLRLACKIAYKNAYMLLPVSQSLVEVKNIFLSDEASSYQGYKHFFPNIKTPYKVIHNGIDFNYWNNDANQKSENKFVSVFSESQFYLKGGDLILETSKHFPDKNFYLIGLNKPDYIVENYNNVFFLGILSPEELKKHYSDAQFYIQLSAFEGFGYSLCEAMLCECIPIGSSVNMIPEIINDCGMIVNKKSINDFKNAIEKALTISNKSDLGKKARNRIIENYNIEKRKEGLISLIENS